MKIYIISVLFFIPFFSFAKGTKSTQLLAVGQGISSPTSTSTVNYSNGFTGENPVGVTYQNSMRVTGEFDTGDSSGSDTQGLGGEIGIGNGQYGVALGYYDRDCTGCDGNLSGALGIQFGSIAFGLKFQEDISSLGFIFNPNGKHRFGLMAEIYKNQLNDFNTYGFGYSYVENNITFSLDASKIDFSNTTSADDTLFITPGVALRFNKVSFSLSYDLYTNKSTGSTYENKLWFGIGLGTGDNWHVAIYHDYVNDWSVAASFYF
jgi:hypothetical protein